VAKSAKSIKAVELARSREFAVVISDYAHLPAGNTLGRKIEIGAIESKRQVLLSVEHTIANPFPLMLTD
jgi:hypothetical protein